MPRLGLRQAPPLEGEFTINRDSWQASGLLGAMPFITGRVTADAFGKPATLSGLVTAEGTPFGMAFRADNSTVYGTVRTNNPGPFALTSGSVALWMVVRTLPGAGQQR